LPAGLASKLAFLQSEGGYDCGMNAGKTMNCPECGNTVAVTDQFCSKCFARLEPPSMWRKLFLSLFQVVNTPQGRILNIKKAVTIKTVGEDGEPHEYHSLDEVPPGMRAEIEKLESEVLKRKGNSITLGIIKKESVSVFKIKDTSGNEHIYHSLNEMPPDFRALAERAQKQIDAQK
jgi:hypothetical protein